MPWNLTGNAGTNPGTGTGENFLGTSDNEPLVIATEGTQRIALDTSGNIAISGALGVGTAAPRSQLEVEAAESAVPGPILTITNGAGVAPNSAAAIDLNAFPPPGTQEPVIVDGKETGKLVSYNPCSRIAAQSVGNFEVDLNFSVNDPVPRTTACLRRCRSGRTGPPFMATSALCHSRGRYYQFSTQESHFLRPMLK